MSVVIRDEGSVRWIVLDRPAKSNATQDKYDRMSAFLGRHHRSSWPGGTG